MGRRRRLRGPVRAWRFARPSRPRSRPPQRPWRGPDAGGLDVLARPAGYVDAVRAVRAHIQEGDVYQANLCRVLSAPLPTGEPDARALGAVLGAGNPAPYAGGVHGAGAGVGGHRVARAVPAARRAASCSPGPSRAPAATADGLTDKDRAENVMITDLVRNDLQRVCAPGTVEVTTLLGEERHPGLVHLVSTVQGVLRRRRRGAGPLGARCSTRRTRRARSPAPQVVGARHHRRARDRARGPVLRRRGLDQVDADGSVRAELAVGIRTFWSGPDGVLRFGTGAGITWGSDPDAEWAETELKAARLVGLASGVGVEPMTD